MGGINQVRKKLTRLTRFRWVNMKSLIGIGIALEPKVHQSSSVRYGAQAPGSLSSRALRDDASVLLKALSH
jgi:hypothetical protein